MSKIFATSNNCICLSLFRVLDWKRRVGDLGRELTAPSDAPSDASPDPKALPPVSREGESDDLDLDIKQIESATRTTVADLKAAKQFFWFIVSDPYYQFHHPQSNMIQLR